ncbi:MAG: hypothetical protein KatS3mg105_2880 [Gemmatales bacterium]|nr:MAG: hypothetical protein KatS3mg105_2880 [Gemmatales bacterium]
MSVAISFLFFLILIFLGAGLFALCWFLTWLVKTIQHQDSARTSPPHPVRREHAGVSVTVLLLGVLVVTLLMLGAWSESHSEAFVHSGTRSEFAQPLTPTVVQLTPTAKATAKPAAARNGQPPADELEWGSSPKWTIDGLGPTRDDAIKDAVAKAQRKIAGYLQMEFPQLEWQPTEEYIRQHFVKRIGHAEPVKVDDQTMAQRVIIQVAIDKQDRDDLFEQNRKYQMQKRMLWLAKALGILSVFLGTVALYIRLDESSKGYYTVWLRLLALAFIVAAGAGVLFLA